MSDYSNHCYYQQYIPGVCDMPRIRRGRRFSCAPIRRLFLSCIGHGPNRADPSPPRAQSRGSEFSNREAAQSLPRRDEKKAPNDRKKSKTMFDHKPKSKMQKKPDICRPEDKNIQVSSSVNRSRGGKTSDKEVARPPPRFDEENKTNDQRKSKTTSRREFKSNVPDKPGTSRPGGKDRQAAGNGKKKPSKRHPDTNVVTNLQGEAPATNSGQPTTKHKKRKMRLYIKVKPFPFMESSRRRHELTDDCQGSSTFNSELYDAWHWPDVGVGDNPQIRCVRHWSCGLFSCLAVVREPFRKIPQWRDKLYQKQRYPDTFTKTTLQPVDTRLDARMQRGTSATDAGQTKNDSLYRKDVKRRHEPSKSSVAKIPSTDVSGQKVTTPQPPRRPTRHPCSAGAAPKPSEKFKIATQHTVPHLATRHKKPSISIQQHLALNKPNVVDRKIGELPKVNSPRESHLITSTQIPAKGDAKRYNGCCTKVIRVMPSNVQPTVDLRQTDDVVTKGKHRSHHAANSRQVVIKKPTGDCKDGDPGRMVKLPKIYEGENQLMQCTAYNRNDFEAAVSWNDKPIQLSTGEFGDVTLMRLSSNERPLVVVKPLNPDLTDIYDVCKELKAMQVVQDHWAFPKFYGVVRSLKYSACVLEFIGDQDTMKSQTVTNAMAHRKKMPFNTNWVWIANDIARGLAHLHSKGYLHCDLKANNALLWFDGELWRAKIIDMGKARRIQDASRESAQLTKKEQLNIFPHIPPEVYAGQGNYSVEGDIYSLGCIIQEIATVCPLRGQVKHLGIRCSTRIPHYRPSLSYVIKQLTYLGARDFILTKYEQKARSG